MHYYVLMIYFLKNIIVVVKCHLTAMEVKYVIIIIIIFRSIVMTYIESTSHNIIMFSSFQSLFLFFTQFSGGSNRLNIDKFHHSALLRSIL